ncbi:hypothetical protein [Caulobacter sp.]|uniref:hypothetical protein n=1 Tax=Caulobacter sp. TaxID=78 RepID=UPI0031E0D0A4
MTLFSGLFLLVVVCLPGLIHSATGTFPFFRRDYSDEAVTAAAIMMLLFMIFFTAGLAITWSLPKLSLRRKSYTADSPRALALVALFIALAAFAILRIGADNILSSRGEAVIRRDPIEAMVLTGGRYAGFFILWINIFMIRSGKRAWLYAIPFSVLAFLVMANPISTPRTFTIGFAIITLITFIPFNQSRIKVYTASFYALALSVALPLLNQISRGSRGGRYFVSPKEYFTSSGDLDSFQSIVNVYVWIDNAGLQLGRQIISAALVFIPRAIWAGKGFPTGQQAAAFNGYPYTNISAPLPAEFFSDFGWIGVVIGSLTAGWLVGICDRQATIARQQNRITALLPFATAAAFSGIVMRGSLISIGALVGYVILMSATVRFIERQNK